MAFKEVFACSESLREMQGSRDERAKDLRDQNIEGSIAKIKERSLYQLDFVKCLADRDYEKNLDTFRAFKFYDPDFKGGRDAGHPSLDEVKDLLKDTVTPAQADLVRVMNNPVFQLVPVTNYDRYTDVYTNFRSLMETGWVKQAWDNYDGNKERNSWASIKGWEVVVTDDADRLMEGDPVDATLEERIKWFEENYGKRGFKGVDFRRFMMLAMMRTAPGASRGTGYSNGHTVLNGVPLFDGKMGIGSLNADEDFVNLEGADVSRVINNVVFKPSLVIPVRK